MANGKQLTRRNRLCAPCLDYYYTRDSSKELFSVDRVVIELLPWPGDLSKAIDVTNLGKYFFEIKDQKSKQVIYSRGFASIYGEWETIAMYLRSTYWF